MLKGDKLSAKQIKGNLNKMKKATTLRIFHFEMYSLQAFIIIKNTNDWQMEEQRSHHSDGENLL